MGYGFVGIIDLVLPSPIVLLLGMIMLKLFLII